MTVPIRPPASIVSSPSLDGIVDNALISSINEVITIHEQGAARRAKAQEELVKLEEELKSAIVGSEKN